MTRSSGKGGGSLKPRIKAISKEQERSRMEIAEDLCRKKFAKRPWPRLRTAIHLRRTPGGMSIISTLLQADDPDKLQEFLPTFMQGEREPGLPDGGRKLALHQAGGAYRDRPG